MVDFLFLYRMRQLATNYLNLHLIPKLCHKAGIPQHDVRGKIMSHRARSTIATQLFNAKEPMSLFELQEWLGHRMPLSTQRYAKITPTKLMKSYSDAGYFARNLRATEVLIDQDKVRSGLCPEEAWNSMISGTVTAPTIFSTNAHTEWRVRNALSTCRRTRQHRLFWKAKRIFCVCGKRSLSATLRWPR